jgi:light-regulated signal transduction histidine kinase (bacteriophytochrome)
MAEFKISPIHKLTHDLKAPLSNIYTSAQLLLEGFGGDLTATQKEFLEKIFSNTKEAIKKIEELSESADKKD